MKKLGLAVILIALFAVVNAYAQTSIEEEAVVSAKPAQKTFGVDVATAFDGDLGFNNATRYSGHVYVQFNFTPSKNWKLGILNRVAYNYLSDKGGILTNRDNQFDWIQLRLFAEKKNVFDTGLIGNKYTLRVEPTTYSPNYNAAIDIRNPATGAMIIPKGSFAGRYLKVTQRMDFIVPFSYTAGVRLRDEPVFTLYALPGQKLLTNTIEISPFVVLGPVYMEATIGNYQVVNSDTTTAAGLFLAAYALYNFTDKIGLGLWIETAKDYNKLNTLAMNDFEFDLELSVSL